MTRPKNWPILLVSILIPLLLFAYLDFVVPRPFGISYIDAENAIFYAASLLYSRQPLFFVSHPATPIYYLTYGLLLLTGSAPNSVQQFLTLSHLVVALLSAFSLWFFVRTCLRNTSFGMSAIVIATIVAWPSFISFMDYLDTVSFVIPFGLPLVSLFWSNLENGHSPNATKSLLTGVVLGLCLATKLSFLPVAFAIVIASLIQIVPSVRSHTTQLLKVLALTVAAAGTFLLLTLPIFDRLPNTFLNLVDTRPSLSESWVSFVSATTLLLKSSLPLTLVVLVVFALFLFLFTTRIFASIYKGHSNNQMEDNFTFIGGGVFVLLMIAALVYTFGTSGPGFEPGIHLRNSAPAALAFPFLLLLCNRLLSRKIGRDITESAIAQVILVTTAIVIVAVPFVLYLRTRQEFITTRTQTVTQTIKRLDELRTPETRIAFWDDSATGLLGEVDFHFAGNYEYGADYFDQTLLREYPNFTFFRLSQLPRLIEESTHGKPEPREPGASFGRLGVIWRTLFPSSVVTRTDELVAGENSGVKVSLIASPASEFYDRIEGISEDQVFALINQRFGKARKWKESIAGIEWVLIEVSNTPSVSPPK